MIKLKDYHYKEYNIPKKNGKNRKIVAPSEDLLNYQKKKLKKLEKRFKDIVKGTKEEKIINGFVTGKNCVTAAKQHIGFESTVVMDLQNFFDTVTRTMFDIEEYHDIYVDNLLFHENGYCAQGFATSPILANIASLNMIQTIDSFLSIMFDDYAFTTYADDIQISTNLIDSKQIQSQIIEPVEKLVQQHKFQINQNKTRIRYAKYGYRKILGINVGDKEIRATRKTMRKIRCAKHQKNHQSLGGLTTWSKCYEPKRK